LNGSILIQNEKYLLFFPKIASFRMALPGHQQSVYVYTISLDIFHRILSDFKFKAFLIMLLVAIILVFLGYHLLFRRNILIPIENLSRFSKEFLAENWSARCSVGRQDELGNVAEALNEMASKIQEKEKKLFLTIESLKQANAELEARQNEQLQIEKLASIGRLAAGVAHEVGNPLGAIAGYIDILKRVVTKSGGTREDIEICDRIETEANRISKIIRALLQQARPTKERIKTVVLKPVLVRSVQLAQIPSTIDLEFDFEEEAAAVLAEEDQLVQVFLNLLVNARHAIEEKKDRTDRGRLKIRCRKRKLPIYKPGVNEGGDYDTSVVRSLKPEVYWVVSVEDNGSGISEADQKKLFEPFFSTKAPGKGTGLGLYVTKSIIESFRGAIVVRSAPNYGASFSVFLPMAKPVFPAELISKNLVA
jgi:signal transduction histidine kinase